MLNLDSFGRASILNTIGAGVRPFRDGVFPSEGTQFEWLVAGGSAKLPSVSCRDSHPDSRPLGPAEAFGGPPQDDAVAALPLRDRHTLRLHEHPSVATTLEARAMNLPGGFDDFERGVSLVSDASGTPTPLRGYEEAV